MNDVRRRAGVEYLPARLDSHEVIGRIRSARLVLAEAMLSYLGVGVPSIQRGWFLRR